MHHHLHSPWLSVMLCVIVISCLSGCSSSYSVSPSGAPDADLSYREMNVELRGRSVSIELDDGTELSAKEVVTSADTVSWLDANTFERSAIATTHLRDLSFTNHIVGGLEGLAAAPVVFVGSWALTGFSSEGIGGSDGWALPAALGLVGGGVGLITGAILGHTYHYEFPAAEKRDSLQDSRSR